MPVFLVLNLFVVLKVLVLEQGFQFIFYIRIVENEFELLTSENFHEKNVLPLHLCICMGTFEPHCDVVACHLIT